MTKIKGEMSVFSSRPLSWFQAASPAPLSPTPPGEEVRTVVALSTGPSFPTQAISRTRVLALFNSVPPIGGLDRHRSYEIDLDEVVVAAKALVVTAAIFFGCWGASRIIHWASRLFSGAIFPPWAWACEGVAVSSPLGIETNQIGLGVLFRKRVMPSVEKVAAVLWKFGGERKTTARVLKVSRPWLIKQIKEAGRRSPLKPFLRIKGRPRKRSRFSDEQLAAALGKTEGNRGAASRLLRGRMTRSAIGARARKAPQGSPLVPYRTVHPPVGNVSLVSDEEIAKALHRHRRDRVAAAKDIGLAKGTVDHRIEQAGAGSPLLEFRRNSYSNAEILWAWRMHQKNTTVTAEVLGMCRQSLGYRLRRIFRARS